jgi:hypothetical protein
MLDAGCWMLDAGYKVLLIARVFDVDFPLPLPLPQKGRGFTVPSVCKKFGNKLIVFSY